MKPCRSPAGEGDRAARTADAEELRGRLLVIGREHRAEDGGDGIEGRVRERQCLGVALDELDLEPLGGGPQAALLEQGRHVVDADGRAAEPGGRDRRVAAAGGDVEDAPAGVQVGGVAELLGDDLDLRRDDGEIAARPGLLLPLLDRLEVRGRCYGGACHGGSFRRCVPSRREADRVKWDQAQIADHDDAFQKV